MKFFIKIAISFLLCNNVYANTVVTKEEVYKIVEELLNKKEGQFFLNQKIKNTQIKEDFKNKLHKNSIIDNWNIYSKNIEKMEFYLQDTFCNYLELNSLDLDFSFQKEIKLKCAELYENFDIKKSITIYLDIYYNFNNDNNLELLTKLKDLYLKIGDVEKHEQINKMLK